MQLLKSRALEFGKPGVFVAFEETAADLTQNGASLGFDLDDLVARRLLAIDYVRVERSELEQSGEFDLEGLFIRLGYASAAGRGCLRCGSSGPGRKADVADRPPDEAVAEEHRNRHHPGTPRKHHGGTARN